MTASVVLGLVGMSVATASGTRDAVRCGPLSALGRAPTGIVGPGIHAGPIWFVGLENRIRLVPDYPDAIYPRKVLIQAPKPPLKTDLTLRGFKCASGAPLRFWYPTAGEPRYPLVDGQSASSEVLRQSGTLVAVLHRTRHAQRTKPNGPLTDYRGYILFPESGKWKVVVRSGARVVGAAVFSVTAS